MQARTLAPRLAAALLVSSPALADTHVVDATGAGDFLDIAMAVAASSDGDLIFVRAGTYVGAVVIDGIDLVLTAETPGSVVLDGDLSIVGVPFGESVDVGGLVVEGAFTIQDSVGVVFVQDCAFPRPPVPRISSVPGYWMYADCGVGDADRTVVDASAVSFTACSFEGAHGGAPSTHGHPGWHALEVARSNVALFDCDLEGGDGGDGLLGHSVAFGGAGGDGLHIREPGSHVTLARVDSIGGSGGEPQALPLYGGCIGLPYRRDQMSQLDFDSQPDLALRAPLLLVGGTPGTFEIEGPVGANVLLVLAEGGHWRPLGRDVGTLLLGGVPRLVPLGTIPAGGVLTHMPLLPDPVSVEQHVELYYQVVAFLPSGRFLSEPRVVAGVAAGL